MHKNKRELSLLDGSVKKIVMRNGDDDDDWGR